LALSLREAAAWDSASWVSKKRPELVEREVSGRATVRVGRRGCSGLGESEGSFV
jgi:hypothetical protein